MSGVLYAPMDSMMPPAPGEFVGSAYPSEPQVAHVPVAPQAAMVPVSQPSPVVMQQPMMMAPAPMMMPPVQYMPRPVGAQEIPIDVTTRPSSDPTAGADGSGLGMLIFSLAAGAVAGGVYAKGPVGAAGGALLGAAVYNAYKAATSVTKGDPDADKSAMRDGTYALGGAAIGVYLLYRAKSGMPIIPNAGKKDDDDDGDDDDTIEAVSNDGEPAVAPPVEKPKMLPSKPAPPGVKVTSLIKKDT